MGRELEAEVPQGRLLGETEAVEAVRGLLRRFLGVSAEAAAAPRCSPAAAVAAAEALGVVGLVNAALAAADVHDSWHEELRTLIRPTFLRHAGAMIRVY
ncbi:MAG TPA: hypothetical protein ENN09_01590, partial [Planctomycetes bacterium]|nr:hypothetical protein [Planctomycetota bacterium]